MASWGGPDGYSMSSFPSADQAPGTERTVIAYQPSYPVNQPGPIISYPMMPMSYPVDYGYYPVEQYQVLPGPSAGPSRSLETPPSYSCAPAAPSAAPTSVFTASTPVVFTPAPSLPLWFQFLFLLLLLFLFSSRLLLLWILLLLLRWFLLPLLVL